MGTWKAIYSDIYEDMATDILNDPYGYDFLTREEKLEYAECHAYEVAEECLRSELIAYRRARSRARAIRTLGSPRDRYQKEDIPPDKKPTAWMEKDV